MVIQILFAANVTLNFGSCQFHEQTFPLASNYKLNQNHHHQQSQRPHEHGDFHQQLSNLNQEFQASPTPFDFDKFNQQAKQLQAQVQYFNQQQQKHIQNQINAVHQDGTEPHFDFAVNGNYTDLEKASEQFVNLGRLVGKQNLPPKVIKITKTVAVKQPVPMPYPVPVVKVVKENEYSSHGQFGHQQASGKSLELSKYYSPNPTQATAPSESFYQHSRQQTAPLASEYDTEPFYITTPQKETIKIIPVPYYVDEHGNKHEVSPSSSSSSSHTAHSHEVETEAFYPTRQPPQYVKEPAKSFQSFTFSYHPPTHSTPKPQLQHEYSQHSQYQPQQLAEQSQFIQHPQFSQQSLSTPEPSFYFNEDSDNSASSDSAPHYEIQHSNEQVGHEQSEHEQHYQYKYVYEK